MLSVGDIEIYLLNDGTVWVDPGGSFGLVPRKLWNRYLKANDDYLVPMNLVCPLIKAGNQWIICDTGLGINKLPEKAYKIWSLERPNGSLFDGLARMDLWNCLNVSN